MILLKLKTSKNVCFVILFCQFQFWDYVCNGCHDLMILCFNINDNAIITIKNVDYLVLFIRSSEAIRLLRNSVIDDCGYIEKCVLILRIESTTFVTTLSILRIEFRIILAIYESRKLRN